MIREAQILVESTRKLSELVPLINRIGDRVPSVSCEEIADIAFACREALDSLELCAKQIRELSRQAEQECCYQLEQIGERKVSTQYCTVSPNPKIWYALPHKREGREELYDNMMKGLGIPEEVYKHELVRFHPPAFMEYCTEQIANSRKPPLGIDPKKVTGVDMCLRITRKRKVDEVQT